MFNSPMIEPLDIENVPKFNKSIVEAHVKPILLPQIKFGNKRNVGIFLTCMFRLIVRVLSQMV